MHLTETVTIINNSGKVISTGKQLVNIFKDAKAAYREKKEALRAERSFVPGIQRAQTFDVTPRGGLAAVPYYESYQIEYGADDYDDHNHVYDRHRSHDDSHSLTSSRHSHRSRRSHRRRSSSQSRPALTESNLQTLSEVSATTPSIAPKAYKSPYAQSAPRDMVLSRPTLLHAATMPMPMPMPPTRAAPNLPETASPVSIPRQSMLVHRPHSDPSLRKPVKEIDLALAYGNIPPDLASRVDLDSPTLPTHPITAAEHCSEPEPEQQARSLMQQIESFLDEAQCIHHTAASIIAHLQGNPEAAAAVALTLAELSAVLSKMSPGFLAILKGGSPAIFALLASPQFLIGAGVAVGVTVVMFGGWKIVKRIRDAQKVKEEPFQMQAGPSPGIQEQSEGQPFFFPPNRGGAGLPTFDEALVLEEELSTIESWRRGIVPFGEDGTADLELISPEADRAIRREHKHRRSRREEEEEEEEGSIHPDESASRSGASERSKSKSSQHRSHRHRKHEGVPGGKSGKAFDKHKDDDGKSEMSHRSRRSSKSKKPKAIEEKGKDSEAGSLDAVLKKEKKPNMLKTLFKKKKDKEDKEKVEISVLV